LIDCHSRPVSAYGVNSGGNPGEEGARGLASDVILRNGVTKNLWVGLAVHR
jgi:hypothetical protein